MTIRRTSAVWGPFPENPRRCGYECKPCPQGARGRAAALPAEGPAASGQGRSPEIRALQLLTLG
eukprot:7482271-Pyramimonas_sp.AAC.1